MASSCRVKTASGSFLDISRGRSTYTCIQCQLRAPLLWNPTRRKDSLRRFPQPRRFASNDSFKGTFTEKVRKKIWGTENPPGQDDPYARELQEEEGERLKEEEERERSLRETEEIRSLGRATELENHEDESNEQLEGLDDDQAGNQPVYEYKPATTWRRMRHMPNFEVVELATRPWFQGFMSSVKMTSREDTEMALQQALIEVWLLKRRGMSMILPRNVVPIPTNLRTSIAKSSRFKSLGPNESLLEFNDPDLERELTTLLTQVSEEQSGEQGDAEMESHTDLPLRVNEEDLVGRPPYQQSDDEADLYSTDPEVADEDLLVQSDPAEVINGASDIESFQYEEPVTVESSEDKLDSSRQGAKSTHIDTSWRKVSLLDSDIKFAVVRRTMQLTGIRVPDSSMSQIRTARDLLTQLVAPPKAEKIAPTLLERETLTSVPNLHLHDKRWTEMDREEELGRGKLIRKALADRGLPFDTREAKEVKPVHAAR